MILSPKHHQYSDSSRERENQSMFPSLSSFDKVSLQQLEQTLGEHCKQPRIEEIETWRHSCDLGVLFFLVLALCLDGQHEVDIWNGDNRIDRSVREQRRWDREWPRSARVYGPSMRLLSGKVCSQPELDFRQTGNLINYFWCSLISYRWLFELEWLGLTHQCTDWWHCKSPDILADC